MPFCLPSQYQWAIHELSFNNFKKVHTLIEYRNITIIILSKKKNKKKKRYQLTVSSSQYSFYSFTDPPLDVF